MSNAELNSQSYKFVNTKINGKPLAPDLTLTANDVGAVPLDGTKAMTGSLHIKKNNWSAIILENTGVETNKRRRYIELSDVGTLNVITRSDTDPSTSYGTIAFPAGVNGNVITDSGFVMKGVISHYYTPVYQFRGYAGSGADLNSLASDEGGTWGYAYNLNRTTPNIFPCANNANGCLTFNTHSGGYGMQIGLSSDGNIYKRRRGEGAWSSWVAMRFAGDKIPAEEVSFSDPRKKSDETLQDIILRQEEQISKLEIRLSNLESNLQTNR